MTSPHKRNVFSSITPEELRLQQDHLSAWYTPEDFYAAVDALGDKFTSHQKFNDPALGFLRDAWTLSRFAKLKGVDRVRLSKRGEQFPDGYVDVAGVVSDVEIAEALEPERRRGLEYQPNAVMLVEDDPVEDWDLRLDALPGALETTIKKKVEKRYQPPPILVVYLNIGAYGHRDSEMRTAIYAIKSKYLASFTDLHVLWQGKLL